MKKNKKGPTVVFKDGNGSIYLKQQGADEVIAVGVGVLPGGAVFKVSKAQAAGMLTSSRYRPATRDEVVEYLEAHADPKKGLAKATKEKELADVPDDIADYFQKGAEAPPGLKRMTTASKKAKGKKPKTQQED